MHTSQDAYRALGVAPTSEDVVIRAAYRALMRKYLAAEHGDPGPGDRRAREVSAAYELLSDPRRRRAYDRAQRAAAAVKAAPAAAPKPVQSGASTAPDRRLAIGAAVGLGAVAVLSLALALRPSLPSRTAPSTHGLNVQKRAAKPGAMARVQPLPCYVQGRPVGNLPLTACAARNGVATGPLDVGLEQTADQPPPQTQATPAPRPTPSPPKQAPGAPPGAPKPTARPTPASPTPAPPPGRFASAPSVHDATRAIAVARAFYGALGGGDGYAAAAMIEPEKRGYGPLSAPRMSRFYRSLAEPLRLTSIYALDSDTVFVRYRFATRYGGVCQGAANVTTTQRGGQTLIRAIRAYNGC